MLAEVQRYISTVRCTRRQDYLAHRLWTVYLSIAATELKRYKARASVRPCLPWRTTATRAPHCALPPSKLRFKLPHFAGTSPASVSHHRLRYSRSATCAVRLSPLSRSLNHIEPPAIRRQSPTCCRIIGITTLRSAIKILPTVDDLWDCTALLSNNTRCRTTSNYLMATLKPQSNGPSYSSNTVTGTLAVDGCDVTRPSPAPSSLYQM